MPVAHGCSAGSYILQYSLGPELPGGRTLRLSIQLEVVPGPPAAFSIMVRAADMLHA
jgi:hypothetical protein